MEQVDTIELSLFASRVAAIGEEMGAMLGRTAFSPNIRDRLDYSCALFDAGGDLLGQATHIPVHLGSMAYAMQDLATAFDWRPGDMMVLNDPFSGGTHLPDITFIAPAYADGTLVGFCANRAHHADIGADAPGSMPVSTKLEEEGLLIPPTLIVKGGEWDEAVLNGLLGGLRDGASALGDFSAQKAANRLGIDRFQELAGLYGVQEFRSQVAALQLYAERLTRSVIATWPQGEFRFLDYLDDDGAGNTDIPLSVRLSIDDKGIVADFDGTAEQVTGNLNCPLPVTVAAVFYVLRCLLPAQVPACAGAMRPLVVRAPRGTLVNACYPAAVAAGNVETSMRLVDVICGALAAALPELIPAASQGSMNNLAMGKGGPEGWDYYETLAGGNGAGPSAPGASARHSHMTNTLNTPVEVLERHYPLRIERYQLRRDSGGAGRYRGGEGVVREYVFLADARLSIISERRSRGAWGLQGGAPGAAGQNRLDREPIPGKFETSVKAGQVLTVETPGGGGFGQYPGPKRYS